MRTLLLSLLVALFPAVTFGATPFEFEVDLQDTHIDVPVAALAPSMVRPLGDGDFYVWLNAEDDETNTPSQNSCYNQTLTDTSDCYSVIDWSERTVRSILANTVFQTRLQAAINDIIVEPVYNGGMVVPLINDFNVGFHIQDLPNCGEPSPIALTDNTTEIACKFNDTDDEAINISEIVDINNYWWDIQAIGFQSFTPLTAAVAHDGFIQLSFGLVALDVDTVLRQPDNFESKVGHYIHAAGKAKIRKFNVTVALATYGGNLRGLPPVNVNGASGSSIGLSMQYAYVKGEVVLDLDAFDCTFNNYCDANALHPSHENFGDQVGYQNLTNQKSAVVADSIPYLEVAIVYEAERATGAVTHYLTALDAFDFYSLTHTRTNRRYENPVVEHPFGGLLEWNYGFWYRSDVDIDDSILLFGGLGFEIKYDDPAYCNSTVPPQPRVNYLPYPPLTNFLAQNGNRAMAGVGLHVNALNRSLDNIYKENGLCFKITPDSPIGGEYMNTNQFSAFLPRLDDNFYNRDMMVVVKPKYTAWDGSYDKDIDQPNVEFGNFPYDLTMRLPHIDLEFYVDDSGWAKMFAAEVSLQIDLGLGYFKVHPNTVLPEELEGSHCDTAPYPCRAIRLDGKLTSELNHITASGLDTYLNPDGLEKSIEWISTGIHRGIHKLYSIVWWSDH
jgi:hypothetical protein